MSRDGEYLSILPFCIHPTTCFSLPSAHPLVSSFLQLPAHSHSSPLSISDEFCRSYFCILESIPERAAYAYYFLDLLSNFCRRPKNWACRKEVFDFSSSCLSSGRVASLTNSNCSVILGEETLEAHITYH